MSIQKGFKVFGLFILIISSMNSNIFPLVTSRIEGKVVEEDTGVPIDDALIYLIHDQKSYYSPMGFKFEVNDDWEKRTDKNGSFRFDNLLKGEYFICIYQYGYANVGPVRIQELTDSIYEQKYPDINDLKPDTEGRIILKEGEIKHLKIEMSKEAIVEIKYTRKTPDGIQPLPAKPGFPSLFRAKLYLNETDKDGLEPTVIETGRILFKNLPGGKLSKLEIWVAGTPKEIHEIQLQKGQTITKDHVQDFTTGTVLYGTIKSKLGPSHLAGIAVVDSQGKSYMTGTDVNGEYWLKGFAPGEIIVYIGYPEGGRKSEKFRLNIQANQKYELNREE